MCTKYLACSMTMFCHKYETVSGFTSRTTDRVTPYCKSSKEYRIKLRKTPMSDSVELNTFTNQGNEVQRCARINPGIESYV